MLPCGDALRARVRVSIDTSKSLIKFCYSCGAGVTHRIPEGDSACCARCATRAARSSYQNPKDRRGVPAGAWRSNPHLQACDRAALRPLDACPRASWRTTSPPPKASRARRSRKPTRGCEIEDLYTVYSIPHISQVYMMFRARLLDADVSPGVESLEVKLVREDEIPWDQLAFAMVKRTLEHYLEDRKRGTFHATVRGHPAAAKIVCARHKLSRHQCSRYSCAPTAPALRAAPGMKRCDSWLRWRPRHRLDALDGEASEPHSGSSFDSLSVPPTASISSFDHIVGSEPERVVVFDDADVDPVERVVDPLPFPHGLRPQPARSLHGSSRPAACDGHADEGVENTKPMRANGNPAQLVSTPRHEGGRADTKRGASGRMPSWASRGIPDAPRGADGVGVNVHRVVDMPRVPAGHGNRNGDVARGDAKPSRLAVRVRPW